MCISIHALLAESDVGQKRFLQKLAISIHALLAESDLLKWNPRGIATLFLSTLSLRRATGGNNQYLCKAGISIHALLAESDGFGPAWLAPGAYFYPRSPCGERHVACGYWHKLHHFYPRSPCGERPTTIIIICIASRFLSTLSLRRATLRKTIPRGGHIDFYPRSPCGERPMQIVVIIMYALFLSTLSLRRATFCVAIFQHAIVISIHALLAESD